MHTATAMPRPTPILLEFDPALALDHETRPLRDGLSVAVRTGRNLWIASDEGTVLERLTEVKPGRFARHARFPLRDLVDLPGDDDEEVDVEGLGYDDGYVWLVGSHALKRGKPKLDGDAGDDIARLADVTTDGNRYLIARIPCVPDENGDYVLRREAELAGDTEVHGRASAARKASRTKARKAVRLTAARLDGNAKRSALTKAVAGDEHLAPFLDIPGKDNGFDIEGLAVAGTRLFVGLRGPVLRGWAVILSMELAPDDDEQGVLRLVQHTVARTPKGKKVKRGYARHFVNLQGMGIRELRAVGKDLLVLAGPTMALDGTIAVFRWKGGALANSDCLVPEKAVTRLFDVPHLPEHDRAEGMTLWPSARGTSRRLLVVYDSPGEQRCRGKASVVADLFPLPVSVQREAERATRR